MFAQIVDYLHSGSSTSVGVITVALMLLFGFALTRITRLLKLPNVTAYIITGILIGPYCLNLVPDFVVDCKILDQQIGPQQAATLLGTWLYPLRNGNISACCHRHPRRPDGPELSRSFSNHLLGGIPCLHGHTIHHSHRISALRSCNPDSGMVLEIIPQALALDILREVRTTIQS